MSSSSSILHMSRSCDDSKVEMRESPLQALGKIPATAEGERTGRERRCSFVILQYHPLTGAYCMYLRFRVVRWGNHTPSWVRVGGDT